MSPSPPAAHSDDHLHRFERLLDEYGAKVNRLARRFAVSESDAEDLTQEIFLDVFRSLPSFRGESALGTWIYRIALNHCLRFRDKARKEAEHHAPETPSEDAPEPAPDPSQRVMKRELSQQVQEALERLPAHHHSVVVLHELQGLTYQQCAQVLEVPVGTVKSRLSNAFRVLRGTLATYVLSDTLPEHEAPPETTSVRPQSIKATGGSS